MNKHIAHPARLTQNTPMVMAVGIVDEDGATVHAALGDVHRHTGKSETGLARHGGRLWEDASSLSLALRHHTRKAANM